VSAQALTTARLRIRAMESGDRELFLELYGDAETMRFIGRPAPRRENNARFRAALDAARKPRGPRFFTILKKRGRVPIGLCSIRRISVRESSAEVGIMLIRVARGRGYALESRRAFVDAAFQTLPIDTIWVQNHRSNTDIARLNAKLGFAETVHWRPRGARRDWRVLILSRWNWSAPSRPMAEHLPVEWFGGNISRRTR